MNNPASRSRNVSRQIWEYQRTASERAPLQRRLFHSGTRHRLRCACTRNNGGLVHSIIDWRWRALIIRSGQRSYFRFGSITSNANSESELRLLVVQCGASSRQQRPQEAKQVTCGDAQMTLKTTQQIALAFAIAISGMGLSVSPGLAFSSEAQQMCTGDAMRLCSSEIPDISRVAACMHHKRAQVSPGCRAVMDREVAAARKARRAAMEN
jgi:hypothetical protein